MLQRFFAFETGRRIPNGRFCPMVAAAADFFLAKGGALNPVVHIFQKAGGCDAECFSDANNAQHAGISHTAFNTADVSRIEVSSFRQCFLRQFFFFAVPSNVHTQDVQALISIPHSCLIACI
jgi:hypothetical protein